MQDASNSSLTHSWNLWSRFHSQLGLCPGVLPCLRLNSLDPSPEVIALWKGEPVETIILPTYLFTWQAEVSDKEDS